MKQKEGLFNSSEKREQMWTAYVGPLRRSRRGRCGVMLFFRNSEVTHGLNSGVSICTMWTDRAPGASIATFARSTSRLEVKLEHRRGPAGSASPRPQQTSDTICRVPGHGQHAPAARDPVARERALRYPAKLRRAAISFRPCASAPEKQSRGILYGNGARPFVAITRTHVQKT